MLVLSRKIGESILLDDNITIKVMDISKGMVRIGIDAPKEMLILRKELEEAVRETNIKAVKNADLKDLSSLSEKLKK